MRILTTLLLAITLTACAATTAVPTSEAGKALEAEQLVRYSLTGRIMESVENNYSVQLASLLTSMEVPAGKKEQIITEEIKTVAEGEHQRLLNALVPIYRRYYTADEIHQLLSFYKTDVARKSLKVSSQIAAESQQYVRLWNDHFEEELMKRVDERLSEMGLSIDR